MTAKEYLKGLRRAEITIRQKSEELAALRKMSVGIHAVDYAKPCVQSTPRNDTYVNLIHRIIQLEREINQEIDRYLSKKHEMIEEIQSLNNTAHIEVLHKRYVEFKFLKEIAAELGISYAYAAKLHGGALQAFEAAVLIRKDEYKN